jgi:lipopolysaccharide export system permease protein
MSRLSSYLVRLFARESVSLLAVMLGLLFLVQCLKIFDVVVVQGQNILTLIGQAALSMPPLAVVIAYVCMGIGIVRAFGALQASHELHIIHTNRRIGSVFSGVVLFSLAGAALVLLVTNFVEPWANRRLDDWSASIAADVVGRTLTPHRFNQVVPGVTIVIGGRAGIGNITQFFADDQRDPLTRRTYSARTAKIASDGRGYLLELHDGTLQYLTKGTDFSEIAFKTYDIGLTQLVQATANRDPNEARTTYEIVATALAEHQMAPATWRLLLKRLAEGLRVISMCVFMAAVAAFPHARRRRTRFPLELVPLLVAYAGNLTENFALPPVLSQFAGPTAVLIAGLAILGFRLLPHGRTKVQESVA